MESDSEFPDRHHPAHRPPIHLHNRSTILFVTVNSRNRLSIFADYTVHEVLRRVWIEAEQWLVGYYVILPDHIHLFCAPGCIHPCRIDRWVKYWKGVASRNCPKLKGNWQADCWDTQMRSGRHYQEKLNYAWMNPVSRGLVATPEQWPFQGSLTELSWCGD